MVRFESATLSRPGGRSRNEDRCGSMVCDGAACWVLADGLGGRVGGEIAAQIAVDAVLAVFRDDPRCSADVLERAMEEANSALQREQAAEPRLAQMRTTAVVLLSDGSSALWAHLGDSRLYCLQDGWIVHRSRDHSVPQSLCDGGRITTEEIRFHPDRNRLLRALGNASKAEPALARDALLVGEGDVFLLCSDGFWEYVTETEMEADLACAMAPGEWLDRMEDRLLRSAAADHDNYSAIAVFAAADRGMNLGESSAGFAPASGVKGRVVKRQRSPAGWPVCLGFGSPGSLAVRSAVGREQISFGGEVYAD